MGTDRLTLLDIARRQDPNGKPAMIYEVLSLMLKLFQDAPAYPSNAQMGQRVTLRSSLPTVGWGLVNQGTTRSKSGTKQQTDTIGMIVGLSEVDTKERKILGTDAFNRHRWSEDKAFLEAVAELVSTTAFYGDELTTPASFTGLAPRLGSLASALSGSQVVSMGSVSGGDGTSIYIVDLGEDACHLIYPRDAQYAGVEVENHKDQRVTDVDGNPMMAAVTEYTLMVGLTVKDPRHIARLANIDVSDANLSSPTQGKLIEALIDVLTAMPDPGGAQRVMYCNHRIEAAFYKQAINKSNAALSIRDYLGKPTAHFWNVPIRRDDSITSAESTVS